MTKKNKRTLQSVKSKDSGEKNQRQMKRDVKTLKLALAQVEKTIVHCEAYRAYLQGLINEVERYLS